ncbi:MAG: extracellular solute-binding protein [Acetobacteraceae bacterium]
MGKATSLRGAMGVLAALAFTALATVSAAAQDAAKGEITMGSWGGGTSAAWRSIIKPFTDRTGIPVRVVEWPDPQPVIRAQAGNPQYNAGVMNYVDAYRLAKAGMLQTFRPEQVPGISHIPPEYLLKDKDGAIIGVPVYFQYYGIAYNVNEAKASDFESWDSLADPKWKGKLGIARSKDSATYDLTLYAHIHGGSDTNIEPGIPLLRGLAANSIAVTAAMAQMNTLLSRGEVAAVPYYSARFWGPQALPNASIVLPREGGLMLPYLVAVPKGSKHPAASLAWLNYVLEAQPQLTILHGSGYIPFNADAKPDGEDLGRLGMPVADLLKRLYEPDWGTVADHQEERINLVEQISAQVK